MPRFRKTDQVQAGYEDLARRIIERTLDFPRYGGLWNALVGFLEIAPGEWGIARRCGQGAAQLATHYPDLMERRACGERSNHTIVYEYRLTPAGREIAERLKSDPS